MKRGKRKEDVCPGWRVIVMDKEAGTLVMVELGIVWNFGPVRSGLLLWSPEDCAHSVPNGCLTTK